MEGHRGNDRELPGAAGGRARGSRGDILRVSRVVARIYGHLTDDGRLKDVLLRAQYDKRNRNKSASQNKKGAGDDDTPTTEVESNGFAV